MNQKIIDHQLNQTYSINESYILLLKNKK